MAGKCWLLEESRARTPGSRQSSAISRRNHGRGRQAVVSRQLSVSGITGEDARQSSVVSYQSSESRARTPGSRQSSAISRPNHGRGRQAVVSRQLSVAGITGEDARDPGERGRSAVLRRGAKTPRYRGYFSSVLTVAAPERAASRACQAQTAHFTRACSFFTP